MAKYIYDLNPVDFLIADALGKPGQRTFFVQAGQGRTVVSLTLEKEEVASLASSAIKLIEDLQEKYPNLAVATETDKPLEFKEPVEPAFRVAQLLLGYDPNHDRIWLIAKALIITDEGTVLDPRSEEVPVSRFVATRDQMLAMGRHAMQVITRGRPRCPLCDRPIDPNGHFCPRTDGHAVPVVF